jgi:hypothetical protein
VTAKVSKLSTTTVPIACVVLEVKVLCRNQSCCQPFLVPYRKQSYQPFLVLSTHPELLFAVSCATLRDKCYGDQRSVYHDLLYQIIILN